MNRSIRLLPLTALLAMSLFVLAAWSQQAELPPAPAARAAAGPKGEEGGKRLREGTRLSDLQGRFDSNGERWIFFLADSDESYKVLENLALERIHKVLEETRASDKPQWIISGTMTEFAGANYLLVSKAVIKPQPEAAAVQRPDTQQQMP